ncbi:hypothetical protein N656DRAFT_769054 [Canariomyces notabilis]|uniref:SUR7 protein n=1 Tax=Canariomyces notabilis TaxID=2074819 RepID=A0AAN6YRT9_9PEZI|nr:hypothetical protein N656DRAFT_769054 [Canariomyces arenarius]
MASFGRFVCVLLPFLLTLASLVAMLIAGLAGVADKSLYMFQVNTTDLSISPLSLANVLDAAGVNTRNAEADVADAAISSRQTPSNITAADLGLHKIYDVGVWAYCYVPQNGPRECTKPAFGWANNVLNTTTGNLTQLATASGQTVTLPEDITNSMQVFSTVSRWTQIVFVIAYAALALELLFGLLANCSRIFSCITWLIALVAAAAVSAAAALSTATSVVVVGAVEATAKWYGVGGELNVRFLAAVWLGAAFAVAAGLFWLFTICCCAPDHSSRRSRGFRDQGEKFAPSATSSYQRLEPSGGAYAAGGYAQPYPQAYASPQQHSGAYEPYSHARV